MKRFSRPDPTRAPKPALRIVPGTRLVFFAVTVDGARTLFGCPPARFLEGLRAADDLLGFGPLEREEPPADELLPWAGDV